MAFYSNGGLTEPSYEPSFPNSYLTDTIKFIFKKPTLEKSFLHEKYVVEGFSSKEIADLTFSSRPSISRLLIKHEFPIKKYTRRENGQHVYGYRLYGKKAVAFQKEQMIIEMIKDYRARGFSYSSIANELISKNIKTKNRSKLWHSGVVRKIYLRHNSDKNK